MFFPEYETKKGEVITYLAQTSMDDMAFLDSQLFKSSL